MYDILLKNGTIVLPDDVIDGDMAIRSGKIAALGTDMDCEAMETVDLSGKLVLPGAIDPHVHMALPVGGTCSCDDFFTGTLAAASGGVTTIIDFTVGSKDTAMTDDLKKRLKTAKDSVIDYTFHAEMVGWTPKRPDEMREVAELGIRSFKFFTAYADSGRRTEAGPLLESMMTAAELDAVVTVHAEDESIIQAKLSMMTDEQKASMTALGLSRPDLCEASAINSVAWLAAKSQAKVHIMHLSSAMGLEEVIKARKEGVDITAETCPHYLLLTDAVYRREDARFYSASPALRSDYDRDILWDALESGAIDFLSTDHCPFSREQKKWNGAFNRLPYGLGSVELMLPLAYSEGVMGGYLSLCALTELTSSGAAKRYGLWPYKGNLMPGADADIAIFNPAVQWDVSADNLNSACDFSPYEGMTIQGKVESTLSRGVFVYKDGVFQSHDLLRGRGLFLPR